MSANEMVRRLIFSRTKEDRDGSSDRRIIYMQVQAIGMRYLSNL